MEDLKAIRIVPGTKISHDYRGNDVTTFSYRDLVNRRIEAIGIPARQNRLFIVDVDVAGPTHQHDGREFWTNFCHEYGIPQTYTVKTPSGGFHFYYRIPDSIMDLDSFRPPAHPILDGFPVKGVDFKYNGWVGAPPTPGYSVFYGSIQSIVDLSPAFLAYLSTITHNQPVKSFGGPNERLIESLHSPFSEDQKEDLRKKIDWMRINAVLTRDEWRDGIFALRAGLIDDAELEEFCTLWSMNKSYVEGDEKEAFNIAKKADRYGPIGPGSIFSIIKSVMSRQGAAPIIDTDSGNTSPWSREEIFQRAQVNVAFDRSGGIKVEPSESNAASIIGAIYDDKELYYDTRNEMYMFKGKAYSDTELTNRFLPLIQSDSHGLGLNKFRSGTVRQGLDVLMQTRRRDTHQEYLQSIQWDGVHRIENFFMDYLEVEDSPYHRKVGKNFWTALAARGLNPGCKFDSVLIIEGHEGVRKSSLLETIGGKEYTYATLSNKAFEDTDELRKMHQAIIVELPELIGIVNRPAEMVKAFISNPIDSVRDLFARRAKMIRRGFVLVGTTNSDRYLLSSMGYRRFWPVKVPKHLKSINTEAISKVRDQLFAEAVQWYRDGHRYWEMEYSLISEQSSQRVIYDPITQGIKESVSPTEPLQLLDLYRRLESWGIVTKGLDRRVYERIEDALKRLGYIETQGTWYPPKGMEPQPDVMMQFANLI